MEYRLVVGQHVTFVDPVGVEHDALVTAVWKDMSGEGVDGCNLVYVSGDENRQDTFGRQIERPTSISHTSVMNVHGNFWK